MQRGKEPIAWLRGKVMKRQREWASRATKALTRRAQPGSA